MSRLRQQAETAMARPTAWPLLIFITALAFRLRPTLRADFPLNDGGLFYQMSVDLQANGYALPAFTSYNGGDIPFTYPPLSFYVAAAVSELPGVELIDVYRLLPAAVAAIIPVGVYLLMKELLGSTGLAATTSLIYLTLPGGFEWLIMGGGMTRSFGAALLVLTTWQVVLMYRRRSLRHAAVAGVLAGLTMLTHVGFSLSSLLSCAVLFLYAGRSRFGVAASTVTVSVASLTALPWLIPVLMEHGVEPFLSASATSYRSPSATITALLFWLGSEPFVTYGAALGVVGLFLAVARGWWVLLVWTLTVSVLEPRQGIQIALIPLSAGAALTLHVVTEQFREGHKAKLALLGYLAFVFVLTANAYPMLATTRLDAVPAADRRAMAAIAESDEVGGRFLVVSGAQRWGNDAVAEWFPVLAEAESVGTIQGREWLPGFVERGVMPGEINECYTQSLDCLEDASERWSLDYEYLYLTGGEDRGGTTGTIEPVALKADLEASPRWRLVEQVEETTVWSRGGAQPE